MKRLLFVILFFTMSACSIAQVKFNGGMEALYPDKTRALGWVPYFNPSQMKSYPVKVDSVVKFEGKYALSIEKVNNDAEFGVIDYPILKIFKGKEIELRGYIKTENVTKGYAGLWVRIDGTQAFDNMQNRGITGTTDWKEYIIKLPYDAEKVTSLHLGALLAGNGKMWADGFKLYIDGIPFEQAPVIVRELPGAEKDTAFSSASKITSISMGKQQLVNLTVLGQLWGFLKYHHPAVAKGDYNWDAELFRVMPQVIAAADNKALSSVLESWMDKFGVPTAGKPAIIPKDVKLQPDYGSLFNGKVFSPSLTAKLNKTLINRNTGKNYYIDMAPNVGNPVFTHEQPYSSMAYPDAGYRLLSLYRYWNMIQYFFPYKHLIGEDWNKVLVDCIPKFVACANATDYSVATLGLIARIHDTHANIWGANAALSAYKGKLTVPFQARFIEDKLVVTGYYNDTLGVKALVKPGDVIETINGEKVSDMVKKFLPLTAASNYPTQLRDLPKAFLLKGKTANFDFTVIRDGKTQQVLVPTLPMGKVNYLLDYNPDPKAPGYSLMSNDQIGYVFPARYKNKDLPQIEALFAKTKGIIVDMRCYPSEFMPFTFVSYIKSADGPFVKFTLGDVANPGLFTWGEVLKSPAGKRYNGKVVVIVNESSQSQAEYTTMAFQSSPNVTVIGSTTAGADGNVSSIMLPGGISTMISGIGVYYPDGTETQRKGVKIDQVVKPTINGIKAGRDELLERAKEIVLKQ
jgi:hypothetical protein